MAEKQKRIYPKGVVAFAPHSKAPEFVKGVIIITPRDLVEWLKAEGQEYLTEYEGKKQLRLQITEYEGKFSVAVDTYKKEAVNSPTKKEDDLPF